MLLAKRHPDKASAALEGEYVLDYTLYEVGKAVWKANKLMDKSTALRAADHVYHLTALMEVAKIEGVEVCTGTVENAFDGDLSFQGSASLYTAERMDLTLVTEDERLLGRTRVRDMEP